MAVFCRLKGGGKLELGTDNMATQRYMWGVTNALAIVYLIMGGEIAVNREIINYRTLNLVL